MNRVERYHAAVVLAQIILEGAQADDELSVAQALNDVRDEVAAGRKNIAEFPHVTAEMFERLTGHKPKLRVVDSAGFSVRVPTEEGAA